MPRIKISIPEKSIFTINIPVRITDINYGGHAGNDSLLSIIHEARMQFLKHLGFTEMNIGGAGLIMADVGIEFKSETFYGDNLTVHVSVAEISKVGFDIYYLIETIRNEKVLTVLKAKTGMLCYNYSHKKIANVPDVFLEKLKEING